MNLTLKVSLAAVVAITLAACASTALQVNSLRGENQDLRAHVAGLEAEKAALTTKIEVTRQRLELPIPPPYLARGRRSLMSSRISSSVTNTPQTIVAATQPMIRPATMDSAARPDG